MDPTNQNNTILLKPFTRQIQTYPYKKLNNTFKMVYFAFQAVWSISNYFLVHLCTLSSASQKKQNQPFFVYFKVEKRRISALKQKKQTLGPLPQTLTLYLFVHYFVHVTVVNGAPKNYTPSHTGPVTIGCSVYDGTVGQAITIQRTRGHRIWG